MAAVRRLGERDPELWVSTLHFLANCETLHSEEISEVVASIEEGSLLPPLIVVQVYNVYGVCGPCCVYGACGVDCGADIERKRRYLERQRRYIYTGMYTGIYIPPLIVD